MIDAKLAALLVGGAFVVGFVVGVLFSVLLPGDPTDTDV